MNVSGRVLFSPNNRSNVYDNMENPIANVPIVLQVKGDISAIGATSGMGVAALTDSSGNYIFTDVPSGEYRLIEVWGYTGATSSVVECCKLF